MRTDPGHSERKIVQVIHAEHLTGPVPILAVLADDGTVWRITAHWEQIRLPPLPAREVPSVPVGYR